MASRGPYNTGSLAEISRRVGVSAATVSRVLRNSPRVSPETRHAVLRAINDQQGIARTSETMTIGVCLNDFHGMRLCDMYVQNLFAGVLQAARKMDFAIKAIDLTQERRVNETYPQTALRLGLGGMIHISPPDEFLPAIHEIADTGFPQCLISGRTDHPQVNWIDSENVAPSRQAIEYLIHLGHRRIGMISVDAKQQDLNERFLGYRQALDAAGLTFDPSLYITQRDVSLDAGCSAMMTMLARPDRPTAVYFANNELALGGLRACRKLGVAFPDDISIISVGDSALAAQLMPELTLISQPVFEMGRMAGQCIAEQVKHREGTVLRETIALSLLISESTGPVPRS
jgi:DNA-binding LacI/PurR family transcriptional regulator